MVLIRRRIKTPCRLKTSSSKKSRSQAYCSAPSTAKVACPQGVALAPKGAFLVSALPPGAPLGFLGQKQVVPGAESPPKERRERLRVHAARRLPRPHRRCHPGRLCCCEYQGAAGGGDPPFGVVTLNGTRWQARNTNYLLENSLCDVSGVALFSSRGSGEHPGGMPEWSPILSSLHSTNCAAGAQHLHNNRLLSSRITSLLGSLKAS